MRPTRAPAGVSMAELTAKAIPVWDLRVKVDRQEILIYLLSRSNTHYPGADYQRSMRMSIAEWRRLSTWVEHQLAEQEVG